MSNGNNFDDFAEGLLSESDVSNFMRKMTELNIPVSAEEIQVTKIKSFLEFISMNFW